MNRAALACVALAALSFCSALAIVYSKHLSRHAYSELSANQRSIDALEVHWSQLKIEEGTFSEHSLVEQRARNDLGMSFPETGAAVMIAR
ncbi:MAG: cell division protein FtsL [Granulosicoccus sp.]